MDVHPFIASLRSDRAPQRRAQSAMEAAREAWRAETGAAELMAELERYGKGAPLGSCPQLENVFTGQGEAERLMGLLSQHYCAAIAANPIGHPPFRHGFNGTAGTILLARSGRAQFMLQRARSTLCAQVDRSERRAGSTGLAMWVRLSCMSLHSRATIRKS